MTSSSAQQQLVIEEIREAGTHWSMGTFGAIAEFSREPGEPAQLVCENGEAAAFTDKGGLRISCPPQARAFAYETTVKHPDQWTHAIALCLPERDCAMSRRTVLTELGPDGAALRTSDRGDILFDTGLDLLQVDVCIRTSDPDLVRTLRAGLGRSVSEPDNPVMMAIIHAGPHRVFVTRLGRAEVYQSIPAPDGRSPDGPHTHVLPKLLRAKRTHAATAPIPSALVPCAHLYPQHPCKDAFENTAPFDSARHERFQVLLDRFGDPALAALKREVLQRLGEERGPEAIEAPQGRYARATLRVALRQAKAAGLDTPTLSRWRQAYDVALAGEEANDEAQHCV